MAVCNTDLRNIQNGFIIPCTNLCVLKNGEGGGGGGGGVVGVCGDGIKIMSKCPGGSQRGPGGGIRAVRDPFRGARTQAQTLPVNRQGGDLEPVVNHVTRCFNRQGGIWSQW